MRKLLLVMLVASAASADPPKYTRTPRLQIDVRSSDRVKAVQPTKPIAHQPVTADQVLAAQQSALPLRHEQEAILESLVINTPDTDPDKPDYLFRLAEQYASELRFWRLKAVEHAH